MKYARSVIVGAQTRMFDVVDTAAYSPRPSWGQTDANLLDGIFENNKATWEAADQWFVQVPQGVQDGSVYTGSNYGDAYSYLNPDGTNGNGEKPD